MDETAPANCVEVETVKGRPKTGAGALMVAFPFTWPRIAAVPQSKSTMIAPLALVGRRGRMALVDLVSLDDGDAGGVILTAHDRGVSAGS